MPNVTVVLGLCGSGKSHVLRELANQGARVFDEGAVPGCENWEPLLDAVRNGQDCAVVEIAFRTQPNRDWLRAQLVALNPSVALSWICFETKQCLVTRRCPA